MGRTVRATLLLACLGLGVAVWHASEDMRRATVSSEVGEQEAVAAESEQEALRRKLLGVWEDDYKGKRTMTLLADGTGTMRVELSGLQAALFAGVLRFDMVWELEGRLLRKRTIGGEPAGKVALVLKMKGDMATDTILKLTESQLLLMDENGETQYDWQRVREIADETK